MWLPAVQLITVILQMIRMTHHDGHDGEMHPTLILHSTGVHSLSDYMKE